MMLIDSLAEERIQIALRNGEFDDLPGSGAPLQLEDDSAVPEPLRVAYRVLRNAGCLPPEQALKAEITEIESLLMHAEPGVESQAIRRRLNWLRTRLAMQGGERNLLIAEGSYREKLIRRLAETPGTGSGKGRS